MFKYLLNIYLFILFHAIVKSLFNIIFKIYIFYFIERNNAVLINNVFIY